MHPGWGQSAKGKGAGPEACLANRSDGFTGFLVPARKSRRQETLAPGECRMGRSFGFYQIIVFFGHGLLGAHTFVVEVFNTAYWPNSRCQYRDCGEILPGPGQEGDLEPVELRRETHRSAVKSRAQSHPSLIFKAIQGGLPLRLPRCGDEEQAIQSKPTRNKKPVNL